MDLIITPSPTSEITLRRFDASTFPQFRPIFEPPRDDKRLQLFSRRPEEADRSVILENRSDRDITAVRYRWWLTRRDGRTTANRQSSDSYYSAVYHPVLKAGDRQLICGSTTISESFLEHVLAGGGFMGGGPSSNTDLDDVIALRFEIDLLIFADGELIGADTEKFVREIASRKPAAEFIAKQIRGAEAEARDVRPVLDALAEVPHQRDDFLAYWTRHFARECLRHLKHGELSQAYVEYLEKHPALPKFYRRDQAHT